MPKRNAHSHDIDRILEELLADRRFRQNASFSSHTYSDQPIIETGRQMKERMQSALRAEPATHAQPAVREQPVLHAKPAVREQPVLHAKPAVHAKQAVTTQDHASHAPIPSANVPVPTIPERYYQLRELTGAQPIESTSLWHGSMLYGYRQSHKLFYEQAKLMEDFEDDYPYRGNFTQYFPTYSMMTLSQLRGYFTWRTKVRAGQMPPAPFSFASLYCYELLCGIGTIPGEQGLKDLMAFRDAYASAQKELGDVLASYYRGWIRDYIIYHGLDTALLPQHDLERQTHIMTLLKAEEVELARQKRSRKEQPISVDVPPSDEELLVALNECSTYNILGSRLGKQNRDDVRFVVGEVFRALVSHCSRRRKTDYVEGLFGETYDTPVALFATAIFYDPTPHPDTTVTLGPMESYTCKNGRWYHHMTCTRTTRSSELGGVLRQVDIQLRDRLNYAYPLKNRPCAAYVKKMVEKAIDALLAMKAEEARRRIDIDLSQLDRIRKTAAATQEALLTDEERGEQEIANAIIVARGSGNRGIGHTPFPTSDAAGDQSVGHTSPTPDVSGDRGIGHTPFSTPDAAGDLEADRAAGVPDNPSVGSTHRAAGVPDNPSVGSTHRAAGVPSNQNVGSMCRVAGVPDNTDVRDMPLSPAEMKVLIALLSGEPVPQNPGGLLLSLVIDSINEKLFDLIGDTAIEFEDDEPTLVEDYEQDVRELVGT